jgi:putative membrane protein
LSSLSLVFVWSLINPHDFFTWFLEVVPVIVGLGILIFIYPRFEFTRLCLFLIWCHAIILMIGGHYTYADVPLFNWIRDTFELSRNHYDRVGHFAQGFFPAIIAREILIRNSPLVAGKWLFFIVVCVCLSLSAFYELIEWWVAAATGTAANAFLGTQGDVWDTQWDMCWALIGSITSQVLLGKTHDVFLRNISPK